MIKDLLQHLFGRSSPFEDFEIVVLDAVASHLDPGAGALFRQQIATVNRVQRHSRAKEVNLYAMKGGRATFDDALRFPNVAGEALLATAWLARSDAKKRLKVEVWLAKGRVFSLLFSQPPKAFFGGGPAPARPEEVVELKVWMDPMRAQQSPPRGASELSLSGWVSEWYADRRLTDLSAPLTQSERQEILGRLDAELPVDYVELLEQTEGATIHGWTIHGAKRIRSVVFPEATYYLIAEGQGLDALGVREETSDRVLYRFSGDMREACAVGASLRGALESTGSYPSK